MYFNNNKNDTNIDDEFNDNKKTSRFLPKIVHNKTFIIVAIAVILVLVMAIAFINRKIINYIYLFGEESITLYQGSDYIEFGFEAYNSKDEDLTSEVVIESNLNTSEIGEYKITYTIGEVTKTRKIKVVAKPEEYTYIYLNTVNNSVNVYLKVGEKYTEPGYQVFSSSGIDLTDQVKVTGTVDTNKKGNYVLTYSVVDSNNVTISKTRTVVVIDTEISLTLTPETYTNGNVTINVGIVDNYFDYLILPNGSKVTSSTYAYQVSENGKYTFKVYNSKGMSKETSIDVKNIDRAAPNGSCTLDQNQNGSFISINASDSSGIKQYVYNNKSYTTTTINLSTVVTNAKIKIYDNANNSKEVTCTIVPKVYISNIKKDGVIITINAQKINNDITGYYFSYTNQRPDKNSGGYISTNKESIDVVRLPGTTYVWVEDKVGKISEYKTINVSNDDLLITNGSDYKILQNISLDTYLKNQGWSIEELNKLMARSVRAAGLYSKTAAATSAVAFQTVLAQKYKIKLPYWWGGKSWSYGADSKWGSYKVISSDSLTYYYYGLDCSGFTTWAYVNAGYNIGRGVYPAYFWGWQYKSLEFKKSNGEIGDFITSSGHVKIIIGKTDNAFITAEAKGKNYGMVVNYHYYNKPNGYKIQKGELLINEYSKVDKANYPSGF